MTETSSHENLFDALKALLESVRAYTEQEAGYQECREVIGALIALCAGTPGVEYAGATEVQGALRFAVGSTVLLSIYPHRKGGAKVDLVPRGSRMAGFDDAGLRSRFGSLVGTQIEAGEVCRVPLSRLTTSASLRTLEEVVEFAVGEISALR